MAEVWNLWETKPPPVCTMKMFLYLKEIKNLNDILFDALKTLKNIDYLHKEAAILSRFLYKHKRALRHDKGTQNLVKINQCLKRYLKLNLLETVNTFKQSIPTKFPKGVTHAYLPTRQMLKWVLLRLQPFAQIFKRIIELSKQTGAYTSGKLFLGWSINSSFLVYSMTARILASSKYLLAKSIEWYNSMYKYLPYLDETAEFLPDYKFPVDLRKWLGDVDIKPPKIKSSIDEVFDVIDLVGKNDEDNDDEEVKIVTQKLPKTLIKSEPTDDLVIEVVTVEETEKEDKRKIPLILKDEDYGVPIGEEDTHFSSRKKFKKKKPPRKRSRYFKKVAAAERRGEFN